MSALPSFLNKRSFLTEIEYDVATKETKSESRQSPLSKLTSIILSQTTKKAPELTERFNLRSKEVKIDKVRSSHQPLDFLFEDTFRTVSSSKLVTQFPGFKPQQAKDIHCLSLPQSYYRITKPGYQLNSAVLYQTADLGVTTKISSPTLASRVSTYLHLINEFQAQNLIAPAPIVGEALDNEESSYKKREMVRYFSMLAQQMEKPKVLCDFCLSSDHVSLECFMPESTQLWMPEKDREEQPKDGSRDFLLCSYCRLLGHASCLEPLSQDDLFSNEDEKRVAIEKLNNLIYSNELWGFDKTPVISPSKVDQEETILRYGPSSPTS